MKGASRANGWMREHPWRGAAVTAVSLFVVLTIFGVVVFDRGIAVEAGAAAAYAVTFALLTGALNAFRMKR